MDTIDILGSLLGRKRKRRPESGSGGTSTGDIFSEILKRTRGGSSQPSSRGGHDPLSPSYIDAQAKELEDLLNVSKDHHDRRGRTDPPHSGGAVRREPRPEPRSERRQDSNTHNDRALVLIRAMLNAAKSDGQIDASEEKHILQEVGSQSQETLQFLQDELAKPLDARGFAQTVPSGMEQKVYMMSLMTIDLDSGKEAKYLIELANALRLTDEVREAIHQRVGAPSIY